MKSIKIIKTGAYFPEILVENSKIEKKFELEDGYIKKRTGIKSRYYTNELPEEMAKKLVQKMFEQNEEYIKDIGLIVVATVTPTQFIPGISNYIQKTLNIQNCICLDMLAGCAGFINAVDIAHKYLSTNIVKKALVVGIEQISKFLDKKDISTSIVFGDGAGAILLEATKEQKKYYSVIQSTIDEKEILRAQINQKNELHIEMKGKEVYKYAVTKTVENIHKLLEETGETLDNIKYIVPHQSNAKIIRAIASRLGKEESKKMYMNIKDIGNTFCASIPIALNEMFEKQLLEKGDKIILLGYGGGLNTGSILLET